MTSSEHWIGDGKRHLKGFQSKKDFEKVYKPPQTIVQGYKQLCEFGEDVALLPNLPTELKKVVFICCNTYTKPSLSLGVGPMSDAINVADSLTPLGYKLYFCHNPKTALFQQYLQHFFKHTKEFLLVYYTGHGKRIPDRNGDENDGMDEALVFDDGFLVDDKLSEILKTPDKPAELKIVLLNDCCHCGTIWDLNAKELPQNLLCLSGAKDSQTAKQTTIEGTEQGIFTFYFLQILEEDPKISPAEMELKLNVILPRYAQCFVKSTTTTSLFNKPIFI
jgi:hypothetical protein